MRRSISMNGLNVTTPAVQQTTTPATFTTEQITPQQTEEKSVKKLRWKIEPQAAISSTNVTCGEMPSQQEYEDDNRSEFIQSESESDFSVRTTELMDKWETPSPTRPKIHSALTPQPSSPAKFTVEHTPLKDIITPKTSIDREMISFYNRPSMVNVIQDERASSTLNEIIATSTAERRGSITTSVKPS